MIGMHIEIFDLGPDIAGQLVFMNPTLIIKLRGCRTKPPTFNVKTLGLYRYSLEASYLAPSYAAAFPFS